MTDEDNYTDDLLEQFDELEIELPLESPDKTVPTIPCEAESHPDDEVLREGNRLTALVVNNGEDWTIKNTCCKYCSIKDIYERADSDKVTAVVEGQLQPVPDHIPDDKSATGLYLDSATVWDIHLPQAQ